LNELHRLLTRALKKTEALWPEIEQAYALVHQAAHVLANHEDEKGQGVRERYQKVLQTMREQQASLGTLSGAIGTFLKVTESYWPGLFHCYDVADLPRTNNELEHCFGGVALRGTTRFRATGSYCRSGSARTGTGADSAGFATTVFLTACIGPA
jgi:hypothetical protein